MVNQTLNNEKEWFLIMPILLVIIRKLATSINMHKKNGRIKKWRNIYKLNNIKQSI